MEQNDLIREQETWPKKEKQELNRNIYVTYIHFWWKKNSSNKTTAQAILAPLASDIHSTEAPHKTKQTKKTNADSRGPMSIPSL